MYRWTEAILPPVGGAEPPDGTLQVVPGRRSSPDAQLVGRWGVLIPKGCPPPAGHTQHRLRGSKPSSAGSRASPASRFPASSQLWFFKGTHSLGTGLAVLLKPEHVGL